MSALTSWCGMWDGTVMSIVGVSLAGGIHRCASLEALERAQGGRCVSKGVDVDRLPISYECHRETYATLARMIVARV